MSYEAPRLLVEHLKARGIPQAQGARELGISPVSMTHYVRGRLRPKSELRLLIERWSAGAVPVDSWSTDEERERLAGMEPPAFEQPSDPGTGTDG